GQHYFSLFQFLLVGLNGAFLTGDLFNLFVFFEVLLAASYGLLLHGSGQVRVRAGLHYIAINLAASLLLLLGISLIYGVTGTLNMAHLASMMPDIDAANRPLLQMGLALMGV
ncbi:monovalent cation/H+ antiporter subunit D, partial [Xylophilus sp. Kf1]|nr:monovalent cation/H+ antiporter subunit D [Xylophilus sp. Kf1]